MTLNHTKIRHLQAAACLAPSAKALTAGGRVMSVIRQPR
jgi:hypothetical protein